MDYLNHGYQHAQNTKVRAKQIMTKLGGTPREIHLASLAGFMHEVAYEKSYKENIYNKESARIAKEYMITKGYSKNDIEEVYYSILFANSGNYIKSKINLAVFLADKLDFNCDRMIENEYMLESKRANSDMKNLLKVREITLDISSEFITLNVISTQNFDFRRFWNTYYSTLKRNQKVVKAITGKKFLVTVNGKTIRREEKTV